MIQSSLDFSENKSKETTLSKVKKILEDFEGARDDYAELDFRFYPKGLRLVEFFRQLADNKLPSIESVHRARRKIQEDYPHLRGKTYEKRQAKRERISQNINIKPTDTIQTT